jgi:hypothetical protein
MQLADRDVKLRAEDIAKVVWKAVHSKKNPPLHRF